jgi:hypothetical protein
MRIPKLTSAVTTMAALLMLHTASAQQISAEDRNAAIQNIAKHIAANYVYPEKGGQIASHIQTAHFKGQFNKATTWKEFDELVTNELRKFSNDGHLYVKYDPAAVSELKRPNQSDTQQGNVNAQQSRVPSTIDEAKVIGDNVGYLKISRIDINKSNLEDLYLAMRKMQGTKSLIIDLRDNGGGGSEVGPVLESFFLPPSTPTLRFTKRDGNYSTDSTLADLKESRYEKPVYIIINKNTASAAEAFAFVLQQKKRARIVGERSAGAAYMNSWYIVNDQNYVSVSTAAPSVPEKGVSWEQEGIQPDIKVRKGDALEVALREANR